MIEANSARDAVIGSDDTVKSSSEISHNKQQQRTTLTLTVADINHMLATFENAPSFLHGRTHDEIKEAMLWARAHVLGEPFPPKKRDEPEAVSGVVHELKTWPEFFDDVASGAKPFEVRLSDRDFHVGDTLKLREWSPDTRLYSGRVLFRHIDYMLRGGQFGIAPDYVVLGLAMPRGRSQDRMPPPDAILDAVGLAIERAQLDLHGRYGLFDYRKYGRPDRPYVVREFGRKNGEEVFSSSDADEARDFYERLCRRYLATQALEAGEPMHPTRWAYEAACKALRAWRDRARALAAALQPFADAAAKADESKAEIERAKMGTLSDGALIGWGIRYGHVKAARAALEVKP